MSDDLQVVLDIERLAGPKDQSGIHAAWDDIRGDEPVAPRPTVSVDPVGGFVRGTTIAFSGGGVAWVILGGHPAAIPASIPYDHTTEDVVPDETQESLREIRADIRGLAGDIRGEMGKMRAEIGEMKGELGEKLGEMRGEIGEVRGEIGNVRGDVHESISNLQGRLIITILGAVSIAVAILIAVINAGTD